MSTPANERLERLFANKPRPAKPEKPVEVSSTMDSNQDQSIESVRETLAQVKLNSTADSSDEDDDYTAAFHKKPKMKGQLARNNIITEKAALDHAKNTYTGPLKPIEFIPEGKQSASKAVKAAKSVAWDDKNNIAYDDDGRLLVSQFCSFTLMSKFPYKYMKDPNDRVSKQFFASNQFYNRRWNLHYLHSPRSFDKGALVLVPLSQVQKMIDEISLAFDIDIKVPSFPFTIDFFDDGTPQPVLLGTSVSREIANGLIRKIPNAVEDHGECPSGAAEEVQKVYQAFHNKIERALLASKGKGTSSNQKKATKLFQILQESRNQLQRAERHFGLRPKTKAIAARTDLSWEEQKVYKDSQQEACGLLTKFLDLEKPVHYPFEKEPIIISIDVESYERNHGFITEIGVSTIDTLDLQHTPPGPGGENWIKQIRSRHFRIRGREHLVNKDFCVGNPDAFRFGESEFVTLDEASSVVDSCFEWPYSVDFKKEGANPPEIDLNTEQESIAKEQAIQQGPKQRNIILLGHDIGTDLDYLQALGSHVFNPLAENPPQSRSLRPTDTDRRRILTSILETMDTATMYKFFKLEVQPRNLSAICSEMGIDPWFAHNAGNDARYTMEAFIKIIIADRIREDKNQRLKDPNAEGVVENDWEAEKMRMIDDQVEHTRERMHAKLILAWEEEEEYSSDEQREPADYGAGDPLKIDWSIPFPSEKRKKKLKSKSKAKSKEPEISMEEQVCGWNTAPDGVSASTGWDDDWKPSPTHAPKGGW